MSILIIREQGSEFYCRCLIWLRLLSNWLGEIGLWLTCRWEWLRSQFIGYRYYDIVKEVYNEVYTNVHFVHPAFVNCTLCTPCTPINIGVQSVPGVQRTFVSVRWTPEVYSSEGSISTIRAPRRWTLCTLCTPTSVASYAGEHVWPRYKKKVYIPKQVKPIRPP